MGIQLRRIAPFKKILRYLSSDEDELPGVDLPKGHFAVYAGYRPKRFVVPISYLKRPLFRKLLNKAEEEYGFDHPLGYLRVPCREEDFRDLMFQLNSE